MQPGADKYYKIHAELIDATIYVAHCPMKKASWLSAAKEIENPYYGADMLRCGAITDSIR